MSYERKEIYPLDVIFPHIYSSKEYKENPELKERIFDGDVIKMTSLRLRLFKFVSHTCRKCNLKGIFFAKERTNHLNSITQSYHLNLYGYNSNGDEIMLTKDHIKPKAKGGQDILMNMDCLCKLCNEEKGNTWNGLEGC